MIGNLKRNCANFVSLLYKYKRYLSLKCGDLVSFKARTNTNVTANQYLILYQCIYILDSLYADYQQNKWFLMDNISNR